MVAAKNDALFIFIHTWVKRTERDHEVLPEVGVVHAEPALALRLLPLLVLAHRRLLLPLLPRLFWVDSWEVRR